MIDQAEKEKYFIERTNNHIAMVQDAAAKIVDKYPEFVDLLDLVKEHDASKLVDPERTPYVELTWQHKMDKFNGYKTPGTIGDKEINKATLHHIKNNKHHPEAHLEDKAEANLDPKDRDKSVKVVDASLMPDINVAEMVADWQAMSEEVGKGTAREWFNKQKGVRWDFSEHQVELIDKLLSVFEDEVEERTIRNLMSMMDDGGMI